MNTLSKQKIEEHLFGKNSGNKITEYQYENFCKYWNSNKTYYEYTKDKDNWNEKKIVMNWFMWYADRDDLHNIQW
jgi:hypothetical protein